MEFLNSFQFQLPSISVLFSFLCFLFMVVKYMLGSLTMIKNSNNKLPPGPKPLPFIGNLHQLSGSLKHHILRDLAKKHGPLMMLKLGEVTSVVVTSPEIAKQVMRTHDIIFSDRPNFYASEIFSYGSTDIVFSPYGDYWRQLRKICVVELLSSKRVQSFKSIREDEVLKFITSIKNSTISSVNLSKRISSLTYAITARAAFGKKNKHQEDFIALIEKAVELVAGFDVVDLYPSIKLLPIITGARSTAMKMHKQLDQILEAILEDHKTKHTTESAEAKGDLVDILINFQKDSDLQVPLTDNNIKAVLLDIFSAGSETSSTIVDWAMAEMIKNPKVMQKAQDEVRTVFTESKDVDETGLHQLQYLKSVIKETLRMHPSAPLLVPRECREECEINGYKIPTKTRVIVNAWAIARDPKYWIEPEKFMPERFLNNSIDYQGTDFEFIPFGSGRRMCPGTAFALANIQLPLAQLLYNFNWTLPDGMNNEEMDMTESFGITVRREKDLCLIPIPYDH